MAWHGEETAAAGAHACAMGGRRLVGRGLHVRTGGRQQ
jgi:hypothetical protein